MITQRTRKLYSRYSNSTLKSLSSVPRIPSNIRASRLLLVLTLDQRSNWAIAVAVTRLRLLARRRQLSTSAKTATAWVHDKTRHPLVAMLLRFRTALLRQTVMNRNDVGKMSRYGCNASVRYRGKGKSESNETVTSWLRTMLRYHKRSYHWLNKRLAVAVTKRGIPVPRARHATIPLARHLRHQELNELQQLRLPGHSARWQLSVLRHLLQGHSRTVLAIVRPDQRFPPHSNAHRFNQARATRDRRTRSHRSVLNHRNRSNTRVRLQHRSH